MQMLLAIAKVCVCVCPSVTLMYYVKTAPPLNYIGSQNLRWQLKDSSLRIFNGSQKFERGHTGEGFKLEGSRENWRFLTNKSPNLRNSARCGQVYY